MTFNELRKTILSKDEHPQWLMEDLGIDFEVFDEGDWEDDGKYQFLNEVYKITPEGGEPYLLSVGVSRSGSYYSEYYYNCHYCEKVTVEQKEITKTINVYTEVKEG